MIKVGLQQVFLVSTLGKNFFSQLFRIQINFKNFLVKRLRTIFLVFCNLTPSRNLFCAHTHTHICTHAHTHMRTHVHTHPHALNRALQSFFLFSVLICSFPFTQSRSPKRQFCLLLLFSLSSHTLSHCLARFPLLSFTIGF